MDLTLFTVPYDTAVRNARTGAGPRVLCDHLRGELSAAGHDVDVRPVEVPDDPLTPEPRLALELWRQLADGVAAARAAGRFPVVLTGICHAAPGVVAGLGPADLAVCWFDQHGDCNTPETTVTGFLDGMAVTMLTGHCWRRLSAAVPGFRPVPEARVLLLGVRDLDHFEESLMRETALGVLGPGAGVPDLADRLAPLDGDVGGLYLHIDLDVLDPAEGRANYLSAGPGLTVERLCDLVREAGTRIPVRGLTLSAYDPGVDEKQQIPAASARLVRQVLDGLAAG